MSKVFSRFVRKSKEIPITEEFLRSKPVRNPIIEWSRAPDGEIGIKPPAIEGKPKSKKHRLIALDILGSFVWERCDGLHDMEEIAEEFSEKYKTTRYEAEIALRAFLSTLTNRGLVEVVPSELGEKQKAESLALQKMKIP